ncbi:hypothetical protein LEP1GSC005_1119 [Leptospira santarosai str. ST188]|uniref:Uncharacterized protein n=1 Tax=Leptospira santarosai str. ZUN179 TaxID=1049985 RepID=M6UEV4_9LEPT|nr:hypothetical protein [Leptospira santarosai]EKS09570.1 hypothetical protein LEP1GSC071_3831 [Leptospira santarosai str. JET]EMF91494.1 hypothetical protein LEP1GSC005_1119 [Leptospira santarosai str. ST188]EMO43612.1 hypothetical protein LEP1GSC187_2856 [Leptospira santarosai str. ZUN179]EMO70936.1 hypothetical protein LEP1GSC130_1506 [Leptospira santarosai str. 200403458]EMP00123.1 hypothetical protein LEP1GSC120_2672 [Leptospira santarosai str. 200702252]
MVSREQKQEVIALIKPKLGERKSCRLLKVSRTGFRNRFKFFDKSKDLKEHIRDLAYKHKRAGYGKSMILYEKGESESQTNLSIVFGLEIQNQTKAQTIAFADGS